MGAGVRLKKARETTYLAHGLHFGHRKLPTPYESGKFPMTSDPTVSQVGGSSTDGAREDMFLIHWQVEFCETVGWRKGGEVYKHLSFR